ncbi:MAG: hypothetical protein ABR583_03735 [Gaiellaceae bacterium]
MEFDTYILVRLRREPRAHEFVEEELAGRGHDVAHEAGSVSFSGHDKHNQRRKHE